MKVVLTGIFAIVSVFATLGQTLISNPKQIDFGSTEVGTVKTAVLTIYNKGDASAEISSPEITGIVTGQLEGNTVVPGDSIKILFTFAPSQVRFFCGEIILKSVTGSIQDTVIYIGRGTKDNASDSPILPGIEPDPEPADSIEVDLAFYFIDEDTGGPIEGYSVRVVDAYFGNSPHIGYPRKVIGSSDECGYVQGRVPRSIAGYSVHGIYENNFPLAFYHPQYGDFYDRLIPATATSPVTRTYTVKRPLIYELRAVTDNTKSFIQIEFRSKRDFRSTYPPNFEWQPYIHHASTAEIYRDNGPSLLVSNFLADELIYFKDTNVQKGNTYNYSVTATGFIGPHTHIQVHLDDSTPDTVTFIPVKNVTCDPQVSVNNIDFGKVSAGDTISRNLVIKDMASGVEISGLVLPDFVSSDFTDATIEPKNSITIPLKILPAEADKTYTGKIGLLGNGHVIREGTVTGFAKRAPLKWSAEGFDFGVVSIGESVTKTVYITNMGKVPVLINTPRIHGPVTTSFPGATIAPNDSVGINFKFTPLVTGRLVDKIEFGFGETSRSIIVYKGTCYLPTDLPDERVVDALTFPNPYDRILKIVAPESGFVTISIYSSIGVLLFKTSFSYPGGDHEYELNLADLPSGLQILHIKSQNTTQSALIMKR